MGSASEQCAWRLAAGQRYRDGANDSLQIFNAWFKITYVSLLFDPPYCTIFAEGQVQSPSPSRGPEAPGRWLVPMKYSSTQYFQHLVLRNNQIARNGRATKVRNNQIDFYNILI